MTPGARVQAAIEVVDGWLGGAEGLDRVLAGWGRAHRFAGSKDRRAIADLVYDAVRRMRSAAWVAGVDGAPGGRDLLRGSLMLDGVSPQTLFDGSRFGPATLEQDEVAPPRPLDPAPRPVRLDYPDWLEALLAEVPEADLAALRTRAPVDLRVNVARTDVASAAEALAAEGIETEPVSMARTALRVTEGARKVAQGRAYREGLVEIQDAASQAVALMAAPRAGERVLDLCAGGGGKTLAMAALAGGQGTWLAHDIASARMKDLPTRAARAGVNVQLLDPAALDGEAGRCDLVMVDAPCSGSGAWRRNPDARWRLTPERLDELTAIQARLLHQGAGLVAPGGRLLYATCSILAPENADQVSRFVADGNWTVVEAAAFALSEGSDGFFSAVLVRT